MNTSDSFDHQQYTAHHKTQNSISKVVVYSKLDQIDQFQQPLRQRIQEQPQSDEFNESQESFSYPPSQYTPHDSSIEGDQKYIKPQQNKKERKNQYVQNQFHSKIQKPIYHNERDNKDIFKQSNQNDSSTQRQCDFYEINENCQTNMPQSTNQHSQLQQSQNSDLSQNPKQDKHTNQVEKTVTFKLISVQNIEDQNSTYKQEQNHNDISSCESFDNQNYSSQLNQENINSSTRNKSQISSQNMQTQYKQPYKNRNEKFNDRVIDLQKELQHIQINTQIKYKIKYRKNAIEIAINNIIKKRLINHSDLEKEQFETHTIVWLNAYNKLKDILLQNLNECKQNNYTSIKVYKKIIKNEKESIKMNNNQKILNNKRECMLCGYHDHKLGQVLNHFNKKKHHFNKDLTEYQIKLKKDICLTQAELKGRPSKEFLKQQKNKKQVSDVVNLNSNTYQQLTNFQNKNELNNQLLTNCLSINQISDQNNKIFHQQYKQEQQYQKISNNIQQDFNSQQINYQQNNHQKNQGINQQLQSFYHDHDEQKQIEQQYNNSRFYQDFKYQQNPNNNNIQIHNQMQQVNFPDQNNFNYKLNYSKYNTLYNQNQNIDLQNDYSNNNLIQQQQNYSMNEGRQMFSQMNNQNIKLLGNPQISNNNMFGFDFQTPYGNQIEQQNRQHINTNQTEYFNDSIYQSAQNNNQQTNYQNSNYDHQQYEFTYDHQQQQWDISNNPIQSYQYTNHQNIISNQQNKNIFYQNERFDMGQQIHSNTEQSLPYQMNQLNLNQSQNESNINQLSSSQYNNSQSFNFLNEDLSLITPTDYL